MGGDPAYALVLLALGIDVLSMNPADIPPVKRVVRSANLRDARDLLEAAMSFTSVDEIERFVITEMRRRFPQLISDARTHEAGQKTIAEAVQEVDDHSVAGPRAPVDAP